MAYCPGCGAVNEGPTTVCAACGRILAVICPQCQTHNSASSKFCSRCGRIISQSIETEVAIPQGEPIAEMLSRPVSQMLSEPPPRSAIIKAAGGGFVFALLFFTQFLHGYPLIGIFFGLISGITAVWGLIELSTWAMERYDRQGYSKDEGWDEELPSTPIKGISEGEGSFADLDREFEEHEAKKAEKPDGLYSSMVSGEIASPPLPKIPSKDQKQASQTTGVSDQGEEEKPETIVSYEEIKEAAERAKKAESLAQFLEDGLAAEIKQVEKKLEKSPRNFSLFLRLAHLQEERGEISKAIDTMTQCITFNPQSPDVYLFYGILMRRNNEIGKARDAFERALALNRFMSKAHYQLGVLERGQKNYGAARAHFQHCIQLSPDDAYAHYQLGMIYKETGDFSLAMMELKRATMLNPNDSYGHSQLGQVYHQMKQWDQAIREYSQALSLKPNDTFVLVKLAEALLEKGELAKAQEIFQEALSHEFHPEVKTMVGLAKVLYRTGKLKELKPVVEEILRLSPNQPDAMFYLSMCMVDEKNFEGALETLKKLLAAHPEKWEAWNELGKLYQMLDKTDDALSAFIKASPNAADQAGIWNTIGVLLSNKKDFEGALKAFKRAAAFDYSDSQIQANLKAVQKKVEAACKRTIEQASEKLAKDAQDLSGYIEMGRAYELLERPDEALMVYQRLLSVKPDNIPGLLAYAELLRTKGKLKMAMRCYREVIKLQPKNVEAMIQLVKANLNLGQINEALRHASTAQKLAPEDPRIHFLLGKIYFTKGLAPRALKEFTIVSEKAADPDLVSWAELMRRRLTKSI